MSKPSAAKPDREDELRDFFRIETEIDLSWCLCQPEHVSSGEIPQQLQVEASVALMQQIRQIEYDGSQLLHSVGEQNRALEGYLKNINRRLELLASHLCGSDRQQALQEVGISEAGLDFHCLQQLAKGQLLALQIMLPPNNIGICLYAEVQHCESQQAGYFTGLKFVELDDPERQQLAKFILQQQAAQRRLQQNSD